MAAVPVVDTDGKEGDEKDYDNEGEEKYDGDAKMEMQDMKLKRWLQREGLMFMETELICLKYSDIIHVKNDEMNILCRNLNEAQKIRFKNAVKALRTVYSIKEDKKKEAAIKYDDMFKIILIGDCGVGKSNILTRYRKNFFEEEYTTTDAMIFKNQIVEISQKTVNLQIYDKNGAHQYGTIFKAFCRGAHAALIIYDVTNQESFDSIATWMEQLEKTLDAKSLKILIGNKTDLKDRNITRQQGEDLANHYGIEFVECSAKTGQNVSTIFSVVSESLMEIWNVKGGQQDNRKRNCVVL
eukprot:7734_1